MSLQLVCRQWKDIAQPIFYREQVHCESERTSQLVRTLEGNSSIPFPRLFIVLVTDMNSIELAGLRRIGDSRERQPLTVLASVPNWKVASMLGTQFSYCTSCVLLPRDDTVTEDCMDDLFYALWLPLAVELIMDDGPVEPQYLILRLAKAVNFHDVIVSLVKNLSDLIYLPHLRIEAPFALPSAVLEGSTILELLQHSSLALGRKSLLERDGTAKKLSFGTVSKEDATALRGVLTSLGPLGVDVEIDTLDDQISP